MLESEGNLEENPQVKRIGFEGSEYRGCLGQNDPLEISGKLHLVPIRLTVDETKFSLDIMGDFTFSRPGSASEDPIASAQNKILQPLPLPSHRDKSAFH